jgi:hypothetical protein
MWAGLIDRVAPNGTSGRADYLGGPANKAARLMGAARGGQVRQRWQLAGFDIMNGFLQQT